MYACVLFYPFESLSLANLQQHAGGLPISPKQLTSVNSVLALRYMPPLVLHVRDVPASCPARANLLRFSVQGSSL